MAEKASDAAQTASQSVSDAAAAVGDKVGSAASGEGSGSEQISKTVYVGNIFFDVREEDLKKEFSRAGPVRSVKIIMDVRGLSKGFVVFPIFPR